LSEWFLSEVAEMCARDRPDPKGLKVANSNEKVGVWRGFPARTRGFAGVGRHKARPVQG